MKIKTFAFTFFLFLTIFFMSLLLISKFFFHIQVESAMEKGGNEHYLISDSMGKELQNFLERGADREESIRYLFDYYSSLYSSQEGYLEVFENKELRYSSFPALQKGVYYFETEQKNRTAVLKKIEGNSYIIVAGYFPNTKQRYTIQYICDITPMIQMWEKLRNMLFWTGAGFAFLAAVLLLFLLNIIFRPFTQVVSASKDIAGGNYGKRIQVPRSRELSVMADSFNEMAEKVQAAITELSNEAEQKQQFIDNFSHEIRTPLTSVYGFAEYLQKSAVSEEERINMAGYIIDDSLYILKIADRLLELAKLNHTNIIKKECRLKELFIQTEKLLYKRLQAKQIKLDWRAETENLYGDEELLQSLLVNLSNNAIEASSNGADLHWLVYQNGNKIILVVSDQGHGIPEDELDKINEPFYRVDKVRNRDCGNAGLGLSICRQIARCHDAEIKFESKLNEGTAVKVFFTVS